MREAYPNELYHHGVLGQRWGVRRYQNKDGTLTDLGKKRYGYTSEDTVFLSGKVKYDQPIDDSIKKQVDAIIDAGANIVIGDAPGADKRLQDYIAEKGYDKVKVYTTDPEARNNVGNWKVEKIDSPSEVQRTRPVYGFVVTSVDTNGPGAMPIPQYTYMPTRYVTETIKIPESKVRAKKDIAMTKASNKGLAVMPIDDRRGSAMSKNVKRLKKQHKPVAIYDYNTGQFYYR